MQGLQETPITTPIPMQESSLFHTERTEGSPFRDNEGITYNDAITDESAKSLWAKFFRHDSNVDADVFIECLLQEYSPLFKECFGNNLDVALEKIKNKISVNGKTVSLYALELFTRDKGVERAIREIGDEIGEDITLQETSSGMNIAQEISQLKEMVNKKKKALEAKEATLNEKERILEEEKAKLVQTIDEYCQMKVKESMNHIKASLKDKEKQLIGIERRLKDYAQAIKERTSNMKDSMMKSSISMSSSRMKATKQENIPSNEDSVAKAQKMKARLQQLESSNAMYKEKCDKVNKEFEAEKEKCKKLQDQVERLKNTQRIEKMKDETTKKEIAKLELLKSAAKPKIEKVEKPQPTMITNEKSIEELIILYSSFIDNQLYALNKSKEIYLQDSSTTIGEMLFPKFNEMIPIMFELQAYNHIQTLKSKQFVAPTNVLQLLWEMISFSYTKYMFPRTLQNMMSPKIISNNSIRSFITSFPIPEYKLSTKVPYKLEFVPKTKKVNKDIALHTKSLDIEPVQPFPLYPLFKNNVHTYYLIKSIESSEEESESQLFRLLINALLTQSKDNFESLLTKIQECICKNIKNLLKCVDIWKILITMLYYKESNQIIMQIIYQFLNDESYKEDILKSISDEFCFETLLRYFFIQIDSKEYSKAEEVVVMLENAWHHVEKGEIIAAASETIKSLISDLKEKECCNFLVSNMKAMIS